MNIRMSTKGKRPLRSLTPSDKVHAIQRIHDGESKASVARDIGVPESTLRGWCKNEDKLRFMSRQSAADKMAESFNDKLEAAGANLLNGPSEKRQRLDTALPLNFSNKLKFDELAAFKRNQGLNGLDYGTNKALTELNSGFPTMNQDYVSFNGANKAKVFGADISRPTDPSMTAISPLSSLTHLSGLTGLAQSPLAISFNELTSNLSLLAQLNPGLAAMSGLNGLAVTANTLRQTNKPKSGNQVNSSRGESNANSERQPSLTVKNWAKQKPSTPTSTDGGYGLNLTQTDVKPQLKSPNSVLLATPMGNTNIPTLPTMTEDPLLYWLKSQQALMGLNNLYPPPPPQLGATSPPLRSSTPQTQNSNLHTSTPPIMPTPLTPSSTPSGSLDDKNAPWLNWYKALGASLTSLAPAAAFQANALQNVPPVKSSTTEGNNAEDIHSGQKSGFENILYSQLTKDSAPSPSVQSSSSVEHISNVVSPNMVDLTNKPEDLSAKTIKTNSSPLPTPAQSPEPSTEPESIAVKSFRLNASPALDMDSENTNHPRKNKINGNECKTMLDNIFYKINNNNNNNSSNINISNNNNPNISSTISESDISYHSDHNLDELGHNNNNNNNNNSSKTDEEERAKLTEFCEEGDDDDEVDDDDGIPDSEQREAIRHGEKFLQWLENCSSPRVTAMQLMQLRCLIATVKSVEEPRTNLREEPASTTTLTATIELEDSSEENITEDDSTTASRICSKDSQSKAECLLNFENFAPAIYQSSATLLNSLFFPPYELVKSDDSDLNDDDAEEINEDNEDNDNDARSENGSKNHSKFQIN
uniref:HTH psq-type domain-containing protein n=1 Tax=Glossina morsitans morsitans TaxID=37546 RepID=A0A1B0G0W6_GLOMM